jgi:hypothetical protein
MDSSISQVRQHTRLWSRPYPAAGWLAALLLALPALWPLFRPGFFASDDGRIHIYRIAALANAWSEGVLHPRLFPEFGFGYGQAVLNFYAPLAYWPGALLALIGAGPVLAAKLTIALGLLLAALAAYGYGRYLWGPAGGVLGAIAYTYFPYHLADAYQRGAIPEQFAFIWPPLILWAYTAAFRKERPIQPLLWGTLAWAGLVYTHSLTALLIAPVTLLYLLVLALRSRRWHRLIGAAGSLGLAIGLTAALWLPVLTESSAVGLSLGASDGYQQHLAPLSQAVLMAPLYLYRLGQGAADHPVSWLSLAVVLLVLGLLVWRLAAGQRPVKGSIIAFHLLLVLASLFMTTQGSLPIWKPLAPVLAQLQYPWRFLTLATLGMLGVAAALPSLLARIAVETPESPTPAAWPPRGRSLGAFGLLALLALALMLVPLPNLPAQALSISDAEAWSPDRMWREDYEAGQVGATWTGEFLPRAVTEQRWALGRPREGALDGVAPSPVPSVQLKRLSYTQTEIHVSSDTALAVRSHQFALPGWQAQLDGRSLPVYPSGEMALVTADVPAGAHDLVFRFGSTPARTAGVVLSTLSACWWAALAFWSVRRHTLRGAAIALLLLTLALDLNALGLGQRSWTPVPVKARLEDVALLVGYDATPARSANALDVTLYWFALRETGTDYKAFVHLTDAAGQVIAQQDGDPGGGYSPTTRWRAGEIVADRHRLPLPAGLPAAEYILKAGLYENPPLRNLTVDPSTADNRVDLGSLKLP